MELFIYWWVLALSYTSYEWAKLRDTDPEWAAVSRILRRETGDFLQREKWRHERMLKREREQQFHEHFGR